jgi:hypothetical protein
VVWRENHQHEPLRPTMAPTSSNITRSVTVSLASSQIPLKGLARLQLNRARSDLTRVSGSQKNAITPSKANPPAATNVTALAPMTPTSPPPMRGPACVKPNQTLLGMVSFLSDASATDRETWWCADKRGKRAKWA